MPDNFKNLDQEKQARILNAGYQMFGKYGYGKTSTGDIAKAAGISKAMVFHYFKTKQSMYCYLFRSAAETVLGALKRQAGAMPTDFFDRILALSHIKLELLKEHPGLFLFLLSAYGETAPEVRGEIRKYLDEGALVRNEMVLQNSDVIKFKAGVEPELVLEMILHCSLGMLAARPFGGDTGEMTDRLMERVADYLAMLKGNLYKESYL